MSELLVYAEPLALVPAGYQWVEVQAVIPGGEHTCAIVDLQDADGDVYTGRVRCWGDNRYGQLGYGHTNAIGDDEVPADVIEHVDVGDPAVQLALGRYHTCAVVEHDPGQPRSVRCWGNGSSGRLGYGSSSNIGDEPGETPASVGDVDLGGQGVEQVVAGASHTCVLLVGGEVRCWGANWNGQLGYGDTSGRNSPPSESIELGGIAVSLAAGYEHTCALLDTGGVRCWGRAYSGSLGYGDWTTIGDNEDPADAGDVDLGPHPTVAISANEYGACALMDNDDIRCWGRNDHGSLGLGQGSHVGDNELPETVAPVNYGIGTPIQLAGTRLGSCVLISNLAPSSSTVRCWGYASEGSVGYDSVNHIGDQAGEMPPSDLSFTAATGTIDGLSGGGRHYC
ncbi:MAG: hypothetical protein AAGC55_23835, partial [Myxococcota bacterium]